MGVYIQLADFKRPNWPTEKIGAAKQPAIAAVAISRVGPDRTAKVYPGIAGIAVIEIPVWGSFDGNGNFPALPNLRRNIETAPHWLPTNRTNIARYCVFHVYRWIKSHPLTVAVLSSSKNGENSGGFAAPDALVAQKAHCIF